MAEQLRNLLIVSHVMHYEYQGQLYAYGPYAREIDIWADLFPQVTIAAPLRHGVPDRDCTPFTRANIHVTPQMEAGGDTFAAKLKQFALLPAIAFNLACAMRTGDALHVRCPGNLGLIGAFLAPLFFRPMVAKYAGQWNGYHNEPLPVRLQRWILSSRLWRRGVVTVYGEWPDQPPQVVPFFTSMMTGAQVREAARIASGKRLTAPVQLLYSGRLATAKCIDVLLRACREVAERGVPFRLRILGDGPERERLLSLTRELHLENQVDFLAAVPFDEVMQWYGKSHILILPSAHSEGWPKVLAEAMCHGVVCIGTEHGLLPWMLAERGLTFPVGDVDTLAFRLERLMQDPEEYERLSQSAACWAQEYSLEGLRDALRRLLATKWGVEIPEPKSAATTAGVQV